MSPPNRWLARRRVLSGIGTGLLGGGLLGACSQPFPLVADNGEDPPIGGIGGTGIVGTLTDFGSLIVNGLTIETGRQTSFTNALGRIRENDLLIGDSLTIEAQDLGDQIFARRVHVTHPLIGEVTEADGQSATVMGVRVELERQAIWSFTIGSRVAVSGVWQGDRVVASRLTEVPDRGPSVIAGAVEGGAIGGLHLSLPRNTEAPAEGSFVTALGQPTADGFAAQRLTSGRFTGAAGAIEALSVEGYLQPIAAAPSFEVSGLGHSFGPDAQLTPFAQDRWLFEGPYSGTFDAETAAKLPDGFADRRNYFQGVRFGQITPAKQSAR